MRKIKLNQNQDNKTFDEAFQEFVYLKKSENRAEDTLIFYNQEYNLLLREYANMLHEDEHDTEITEDESTKKIKEIKSSLLCTDINKSFCTDYTNQLIDSKKEYSPFTINKKLRALRAIVYYCIDCGYTPHFKIKMISVEEVIRETYTDEELTRLLTRPDLKKCSFVEYRSWVMINTFYGEGQRLKSTRHLKISDIRFDTHFIMFYNFKKKRYNPVPMSRDLEKILRDYIVTVGLKESDYLFPNQWGDLLSSKGCQDSIADYHHKCGVVKTSIHLYRHTFAKHYLINGGRIEDLQILLDHSTLEMVRIYARLFGTDIQPRFDENSPLDVARKRFNIQEKQKIRTRTKH